MKGDNKKKRQKIQQEEQNFAIHVHEEGSVYDFLGLSMMPRDGKIFLGTATLTLSQVNYPITSRSRTLVPKVDSTKLSVRTPKDYRDMRNQAQRKGEPEAKVFVTEVKKVRHFRFHL